MYCGALEIVDENLQHIRVESRSKRRPSLENALVQNIATGCTTVVNRAAVRLTLENKVEASEILMHDWWLYQVVSAFGSVIYDDTPRIKYRQHGANVIGSSSGFKLWAERLKRQLGSNRGAIRRQAKELARAYGADMSERNAQMVSDFLRGTGSVEIRTRVAYAIRTSVHRQSRIDDMILRLLMMISRV